MKKIIRVKQALDNSLHLTWIINNLCTNSCSYCPSVLHTGANHHYDYALARKFFDILFDRYSKIHCAISGGEPTLSPFLPEIVDAFYARNHEIGLTSNGVKTVRYWQELAPKLNYVCLSWHPENPDPDFIEKARLIGSLTSTTVRVMMHPAYWKLCYEFFKQLEQAIDFVQIEPVRILAWSQNLLYISESYTREQLAWFEEKSQEPRKMIPKLFSSDNIGTVSDFYFNDGTQEHSPLPSTYINAGMTNFRGYTCEIGLRELFVNYDGSITKGNCDTENIIGTLNDPFNIDWPAEPVTCDLDLCHCPTSVLINKWI